MAEVGSGSEKYPHGTLCHSQEQKYQVTHFVEKVPEKDACWSSDDTVRLLGGALSRNTQTLVEENPKYGNANLNWVRLKTPAMHAAPAVTD